MSARIVEIKAFVPTRDFAQSLEFYRALGFDVHSSDGGIAYLSQDGCSFLLQDFYLPQHADNFLMHLLVENVDAWHAKAEQADLVGRFGVRLSPIQVQPYRMRDFNLSDPSGVCWVIGENIPPVVAHGAEEGQTAI